MSPKQSRPKAVKSYSVRLKTDGCGDVYVTVTVVDGRCFELFISNGKAGGCFHATGQVMAELTSRAWRSGMDTIDAINAFDGHSCHMGPKSCMSRMALAIKAVDEHLANGEKGDINDITEHLLAEEEVHHG